MLSVCGFCSGGWNCRHIRAANSAVSERIHHFIILKEIKIQLQATINQQPGDSIKAPLPTRFPRVSMLWGDPMAEGPRNLVQVPMDTGSPNSALLQLQGTGLSHLGPVFQTPHKALFPSFILQLLKPHVAPGISKDLPLTSHIPH